jgi:hypothetical protein
MVVAHFQALSFRVVWAALERQGVPWLTLCSSCQTHRSSAILKYICRHASIYGCAMNRSVRGVGFAGLTATGRHN